MKSIWTMLLISCLFALNGCAYLSDDGRMTSWERVRASEEATKQEFLITKRSEIEKGNPADHKRNPTLKMTTMDSAGQPVTVEMDIAPVIAAATGNSPEGSGGDTYGVDLEKTQMPRSAGSEDLEAFGSAVAKVGNTPALVAGAVGASIAGALRETGGGGQTTNIGRDGQVTQATTKTTTVSVDNDTAANSSGQGSTATVPSGGGTIPVAAPPVADSDGSTVVE